VTSLLAVTERYEPSRHDRSAFESGSEALDRWLVRYAGQSEWRDAARTFVMADAGAVIGYFVLLAGELEHGEATEQIRRGMSRHYPIPVAILARLAVGRRHQHRGLGAMLLRDALERVVLASEELAVRAVVVHAVGQRAARFYEHFGFRALSSRPRALMVTLVELRAAGYGR
jgi:GNAT superfamily N-acetyltransferase